MGTAAGEKQRVVFHEHSHESTMTKIKQLPKRSQVKATDQWDLARLFASDDAWETAFTRWEKRISGYEKFRGTLGKGAKEIAACFKFDIELDRAAERLGTYAFLKTAEDTANSTYQRMQGRYQNAASRAGQVASYIRPEIMAIPAAKMKKYLAAKELAPYRLSSSGCCVISRTRYRTARKSCWRCKPKCRSRPARSFAN